MIGQSREGEKIADYDFTKDSRWLLVSGKSGQTTISHLSPWNRLPQTWTGKIAVSPDSHWLAGFTEGVLEIRDLNKGVRMATLLTEGPSSAIVFNADGNLLANRAMGSKLVSVYHIPTHSELSHIYFDSEVDLQFSPEARFLATTGSEGTRVWLLHPPDLVAEACTRALRNLTLEEWEQYVGDEPPQPTCPLAPILGESLLDRVARTYTISPLSGAHYGSYAVSGYWSTRP
jgi:hypothetical protein